MPVLAADPVIVTPAQLKRWRRWYEPTRPHNSWRCVPATMLACVRARGNSTCGAILAQAVAAGAS